MSLIYENRILPYSVDICEQLSCVTHLHKHAELVYVLEGELEMTVEKHTCTLQAGQAGFAFPNCAHSYATHKPTRVMICIFDASLAGDCASVLLTQHPVLPFVHTVAQDAAFLAAMLNQVTDVQLVKGYLQIICVRLFEQMQLEPITKDQDGDWTHRALIYLNEHFTESITLDDLAAHLNISKYHLSRSFPERIGCGLNAYIHSLRADHAATLLASTQISVTQVGFDSGFESSATFFRAFKTQYGVSPKQYRDHFKNENRGG